MNYLKKTASSKGFLPVMVFLTGVSLLLFTTCKTNNYPQQPDPPGSGNVRWAESQTPDG